MPKTISEKNLRLLLDQLIKDEVRVVAPKEKGPVVLYEPLSSSEELILDRMPKRSPKELFFPVCENILAFQKTANGVQVTDVDVCTIPETLLLAPRPCDAAAAPVLDSVFSWDYHDEFYLERRRKTTVITIACTRADEACFCTAVGLSPDSRDGSDLFLAPLNGDGYLVEAVTVKGERLLEKYANLFTQGEGKPEPIAQPDTETLDLKKLKEWLDNNFESDLWTQSADACAGCGACAFVCPACHCFDIVDEGSETQGVRRKFWDACGFSKFTNHASGHNPRDIQGKRFRNRVMHKFKYYEDKFGKTLCTGCGRCIRVCPAGVDLKAVLDEIAAKG